MQNKVKKRTCEYCGEYLKKDAKPNRLYCDDKCYFDNKNRVDRLGRLYARIEAGNNKIEVFDMRVAKDCKPEEDEFEPSFSETLTLFILGLLVILGVAVVIGQLTK